MVLFERHVAWLREKRLSTAYFLYRRKRQQKHLKIADEKYPLALLRQEIVDLTTSARKEAEEEFRRPLTSAEMRLKRLDEFVRAREREIRILETDQDAEMRDANDELEGAYRKKRKLITRHAEIRQDLREIHGSIHQFHEDRKDWLGQRQPLPQWSFFGQSWNDLEKLKDAVSDHQEILNELSDDISAVERKIGNLKDRKELIALHRQEKKDLRKQGKSIESLEAAVRLLEIDRTGIRAEIRSVKLAIRASAKQLQLDAGVPERKKALAEATQARERFIRLFDDPRIENRRNATYRRAWLAKRDLAIEVPEATEPPPVF